jgi:hypothetical protein
VDQQGTGTVLDQVKAAFDLIKMVPEAIGYDTFGPITFPLPDELRDVIPSSVAEQLRDISVLNVRVDNFSNKTQRNLRILFSGGWSFAPQISFYRRNVKPKYELHIEEKELVLLEIPPNESVSIDLFNPDNHFRIEQVLVGDTAVTHLMQRRAEAKRYPAVARWHAFAKIALVVSICTLAATSYLAWNRASENQIIESATSGLASCVVNVYANKPSDEAVIIRKFQQTPPSFAQITLALNKVNTLSELLLKEQVLLCEMKP